MASNLLGRTLSEPQVQNSVLARNMVGSDHLRYRLHLHYHPRLVSGGTGAAKSLWRETAHQQAACFHETKPQRQAGHYQKYQYR